MEIRTYIHESLKKLQMLGIDVVAREKDITDSFVSMPEEVLEAMDQEQVLGMILCMAGMSLYTEKGPMEMYVFDVEVTDVSQMYTEFLENVSCLAGGELEITDIEESFSREVFEAGTGIQPVRFSCNGTTYRYEAKFEYDWFDTGILTFMNQVIDEQDTGSHLYVTGDGYQECVVFYRTKEWAEHFYELFQVELERA